MIKAAPHNKMRHLATADSGLKVADLPPPSEADRALIAKGWRLQRHRRVDGSIERKMLPPRRPITDLELLKIEQMAIDLNMAELEARR
jgi:hypothetical protein